MKLNVCEKVMIYKPFESSLSFSFYLSRMVAGA